MWLKSAAKDFKVGDIVKETATGREGLILNFYSGHYIIEFMSVADNPFKRETKTLRKEYVLDNFTKVKSLGRSAANESEVSKEDIAKVIEEFLGKGVSAEELEAKAADIQETIADDAERAFEMVMKKGTEIFGEGFKDRLTLSALPPTLAPTPEEAEIVTGKEIQAVKDIEPVLRALFPYSSSIQKKIDRIVKYAYTTYEGKAPVEVEYYSPSLNKLAEYFLNLHLAAKGMPLIMPKEKLSEYGTTYGFDRLRSVIRDTLGEHELMDRLEAQSPAIRKDLYTWLFEKGRLDPKDLETVKQVFPEIGAAPEETPLQANMKAIFDIVVGDRVKDARYGDGLVTDITNLEHGYVGVEFSPTVKVSAYPAAKITTPFYTQSNEFACPMDKTPITAEACLGDMPGTACSYLKFIDNKPTCIYAQEMNAMAQKIQDDKIQEVQRAAEDSTKVLKVKERLSTVLNTANFDDHNYYTITKYTPVRVAGIVKKKNANLYGRVLLRNADDSLMIQWSDGSVMPMWESEVLAVDKDTCQKLEKAQRV